ncbi:MAG TPA: peptidase M1 [Bacteroidales bacterium]|nr:peptidase M1 [Bacteroidales bacterium]
MRKILRTICLLVGASIGISAFSFAQVDIFPKPNSERITNYNISVKLDADKKLLDGDMLLSWRNPSADLVNELQFHLYLNAFKNTKSTFMQESGGSHRGFELDESKKEEWGYVDVVSMKVVGGEELTNKIAFIHPDDNNENDQTVISVKLDKPVKPNEEIQLEIKFVSKLPKIFARTGYSDKYFLVGQWFPKLGVYEPQGQRYAAKGQWNCHQFHANSEFYANFSVYNVSITLPNQFVVGSGGLLQSEKDNGDGTKTLNYRAEDIVDFAWTASPKFKIAESQWKHVKIKVLLQPEHFSQADRHINSAKAALAYFEEHLGEYPYPYLTIVDPPYRGMGSAGMEYTTFITAGCFWGMPNGIRLTEMVTIHEFGHAYFMGILASNEFEEPWLDEGFNTYFETRIMDYAYGEKSSLVDFLGFKIGDGENTRNGYVAMGNPKIAENFRYSWDYKHGGYGSLSYMKTGTWMSTLDNLVGRETMDEIMKTYYSRWKFKHPCATDFIAVVNEVVMKNHGTKFGMNMNWYFDQVLYGSNTCDYSVASIDNRKVYPDRGLADVNGEKVMLKDSVSKNKSYKSKVIITRLGEVCVPVDVLIRFENGDEIRESWDGKARSIDFSYERPEKILWAKVDPDNKILIDINQMNNSLTTKPKSSTAWKLAMKFLFVLQNMMQTFSIFS